MPFTFYYNQLPAGIGPAMVAAGSERASFARRIELARLQLASQGLEMERARDLQTAADSQFRQRALTQQMEQDQQEKQRQFQMDQQKLAQQQGQFNAGMEMDQARMGQQQSQFDAGQAFGQRKLDMAKQQQVQEENQMLLKEYNQLSKSGAVPYSQEKFDPAKHVEYVDVKNRMWMMPKQALNPQAVTAWVGFAKNKLSRLDGEMQYSSTKRKELLEALAAQEQVAAKIEKKVADAGNEKMKARYETAAEQERAALERVKLELAGIRPAEVVRQDIDLWERQYQGWIGMLPPEVQQQLMTSDAGKDSQGKATVTQERVLTPAERLKAAEEYTRSRFGIK
jgi:hypothetical protein